MEGEVLLILDRRGAFLSGLTQGLAKSRCQVLQVLGKGES